MEYIVIPTHTKTEAAFFMGLLKKMHKEASMLSSKQMEDSVFIAALKQAEQSGIGSLTKVKAHLSKIALGK